jgi:hypothetical protein
MYFQKPYTLAGFEPRSPVPEAMTTVPSSQDNSMAFTLEWSLLNFFHIHTG